MHICGASAEILTHIYMHLHASTASTDTLISTVAWDMFSQLGLVEEIFVAILVLSSFAQGFSLIWKQFSGWKVVQEGPVSVCILANPFFPLDVVSSKQAEIQNGRFALYQQWLDINQKYSCPGGPIRRTKLLSKWISPSRLSSRQAKYLIGIQALFIHFYQAFLTPIPAC